MKKEIIKIGDKVRILDRPNFEASVALIGATGTVVSFAKEGDVLVQLDVAIPTKVKWETVWWVKKDHLIIIENEYLKDLKTSEFIGGHEVIEQEIPSIHKTIEAVYKGLVESEKHKDERKQKIRQVITILKDFI